MEGYHFSAFVNWSSVSLVTVELCQQMVAEDTASAVLTLKKKMLYHFSVLTCILKLETYQICSGNWLNVMGIATYLYIRKYLKVYMASVCCESSRAQRAYMYFLGLVGLF